MSRYSALSVGGLALFVTFSCFALATDLCTPPASLQARLGSHANAASYTELGTWYGDHKRFSCAAKAYQSALRLQPGSSRLLYLLGLSLFSAGSSEEAIPPLRQSIEISPVVLAPHLILAAAFDKLGRKAEARTEWQAALNIDPHSSAVLDGFARNLLKEGNTVAVVKLLGTSPTDERLTIDLAEAYVQLKLLDDARKLLSRALSTYSSSIPLSNMLARIEIQQYHYQAAEEVCARSAKIHPSDFETQRLYLQALVLAGNTQAATPLARKLLARAPQDPDLLYLDGVLDHDAGDLETARTHLEQAVAANPAAPAARYSLGQVLAQLNEPKQAKEQLEKAIELGASEPEVHLELARVLRVLGEVQTSAGELTIYQHELRKRQNEALAASKTAQGDKEMAASNPAKAVSFYREGLEATPADAQLNYKLAVALDAQRDIIAERAALERAIQLNPDLAVAHNQLGFLASKGGDNQAAENHFREAVRAAPGFTEAWLNLAATLGLESRFAEAKEAVSNALRMDPTNPQALLLRDTLAKALARP